MRESLDMALGAGLPAAARGLGWVGWGGGLTRHAVGVKGGGGGRGIACATVVDLLGIRKFLCAFSNGSFLTPVAPLDIVPSMTGANPMARTLRLFLLPAQSCSPYNGHTYGPDHHRFVCHALAASFWLTACKFLNARMFCSLSCFM
jgi:hypothetical protein